MASSTVDTVIPAPRETVYRFFTERDGVNPYMPIDFTLARPGSPTPTGVGAQYRVGKARVGFIEETTRLVPNERIEYKIVKGAPVKRHVGIITFTDVDNGTLVTYTMESEPSLPVPSAILEFGLKQLIGQMLTAARKALA